MSFFARRGTADNIGLLTPLISRVDAAHTPTHGFHSVWRAISSIMRAFTKLLDGDKPSFVAPILRFGTGVEPNSVLRNVIQGHCALMLELDH